MGPLPLDHILHQLSLHVVCAACTAFSDRPGTPRLPTQRLMKTTSILIKAANAEPESDSRNTNLWVRACQVTVQQANAALSPLSAMSLALSLALALFSCCRQLRTAETSNLLLGDRARPEQACGVVCVRGGGGWGAVELAPASAPARPCLAALNLSPIKSPSLAGCNWARRAGSMWLLKMRRLEEERGREKKRKGGRKQGRWRAREQKWGVWFGEKDG